VLGYTHPDVFEFSLKKSLAFPDEKNKEIVQEINEQILGEIREKLKSLNEKEKEKYVLPKEEINTTKEENSVEIHKKTTNEEKSIKDLENKKIMEAVAFKKLSGSFNSPMIKTEYTLNNLSKKGSKNETHSIQNTNTLINPTPVKSESVASSPASYKEDPYRVKPE